MTELPENIQEAIKEFAGATASVAGILMLSLDHEVNHDAIHREIERLAVANDVLEKTILDAISKRTYVGNNVLLFDEDGIHK